MKTSLCPFDFVCFLMLLLFSSCNQDKPAGSIDKWKQEILNTEHSFAHVANSEGLQKAFTTYAANDAVLLRGDRLIKGKKAIHELYKDPFYEKAKLSWTPDYVEVSVSGDFGFTYGRYFFSYQDSLGNPVEHQGVFHTVWKRQDDGTWRFVWD